MNQVSQSNTHKWIFRSYKNDLYWINPKTGATSLNYPYLKVVKEEVRKLISKESNIPFTPAMSISSTNQKNSKRSDSCSNQKSESSLAMLIEETENASSLSKSKEGAFDKHPNIKYSRIALDDFYEKFNFKDYLTFKPKQIAAILKLRKRDDLIEFINSQRIKIAEYFLHNETVKQVSK